MVEIVRGNLLEADVQALVNTVNTVGIMGKGIALQFKKAFPDNFKAYEQACEAAEVAPGRMFIFDRGPFSLPRYIINFPTKRHWKAKSRIEDIRAGLTALVKDVRRLHIESLALPPLGCGQGGLNWSEVSRLIEAAFAPVEGVRVLVYEPAGAPAAEAMVNRTPRPKMTIGQAVVLGLMNRYLSPGYEYLLTLLEVYKLAYFMQAAGQRLRLKFEAGPYGPYADNLRHLLNRMEGHFIQGLADGKNEPSTSLQVRSGAVEEAEEFLKGHPDAKERFARVAELIEGFETPVGMELLSSVHWIATHPNKGSKTDLRAAIAGVRSWSDRKAKLFEPEHIEAAWTRLRQLGWLEEPQLQNGD
jgi:O-acetyl-ADP-ribose deacetylase (regulator of RNase III)